MKTYDLVTKILTNNPKTRDSDKLLIWEVYKSTGIIKTVEHFGLREAILRENFLSSNIPPTESITRARRKAQEKNENLRASPGVEKARREKENQKGTFIFREETKIANKKVEMHEVESFTDPNKKYIIRAYPDGSYKCSCKGYVFNQFKNKNYKCKHIKKLMEKNNT